MSPALRLFSARRRARAATGNGSRTTLVGMQPASPFSSRYPSYFAPTFCYRKSDRNTGGRQGELPTHLEPDCQLGDYKPMYSRPLHEIRLLNQCGSNVGISKTETVREGRMPVKALNSRAVDVPAEGEATVLQWLLTETRHETTLDGLMAAFCLRLRAAGFPIARSVLQLHTHHPQWLGTRIIWRRGESGAVAEPIAYGVMQSRMYLDSPVAALHDGVEMVRVRLEGAPPANEYSMFASLRRDGFTDYVGWPLLFTLDQMHTMTFASDRPGGFTAVELECVAGLLPAFALTIEVRFKNELSRRLLNTYVGPHAGEQILSGMTTRGSGRTIEAAVAMFDLRGFTALSDTHSRDDVIAMLNDYFDAIAEPIDRHGGEILKFMGDGLLAVFPLDRAAACEDALSAVSGACRRNARTLTRLATGRRQGGAGFRRRRQCRGGYVWQYRHIRATGLYGHWPSRECRRPP